MSKSVRDIRANIWINDKTGGKTLRELNNEARKLRNELNHLPKGTAEFADKSKRLREVQSGMRQIREEISGVGFSWQKAADKFNRYTGLIGAGIAAVAGVVLTLKNWLDGSAKLADAQADVAKTTGLTNAELATLQERLGTINTRSSRLELLKLAEEAGRLGKTSVSEIEGFVRVADQLKVALGDDLGGEEAIRDVGKLTEIYRVGTKHGTNFEQSMLKLGSAINEVSASGANQAGYLVDYLKRLAGISTQTTLTAEQQIGYAAAFDESGQQVETSATAMSKVITNMFKDVATYAEIAGVSQEDFSKLLREDTNEALLLFLQGLNGNNEGLEVMAQKMDGLGLDGARAVATLASLAGNLDLVRTRQSQANVAMVEGTSLTNEFNKKNENLAGNLEKIRRALYGKFISSSVVDAMTNFTNILAKMVAVPVSETVEKDRIQLRLLELQLYDTNTSEEQRLKIINDLQAKYPEYMKHINADTVSNEELSIAIEKVNDSLIERIRILAQEETMSEHLEKTMRLQQEQNKIMAEANEYMIKLEESGKVSIDKNLTGIDRLKDALGQLEKQGGDGFFGTGKNIEEARLEGLINRADHLGNLMDEQNEQYLEAQRSLEALMTAEENRLNAFIQGNQDAQEETTETTEEETNKRKVLTEEEKKALEEFLEKKKIANQEIQDFLNKLNDDELEDTKRKFEKLLEMADKYKLDRTALEQAMQEELRAINYEQIDQEAKAEQERQLSLMENAMQHLRDAEEQALLESQAFTLMTTQEQHMALEQLEIAHLQRLLEARALMGEDTLELEREILKKRVEINQQATKSSEKNADREVESAFRSASAISMAEQEKADAVSGAGNRAIMSARQAVKASMMEAIASALASVFKSMPFPINVAIAAGTGALVSSLFDGLVGFHQGGYTGTGLGIPDPNVPGQYIAGVVHGNEYVVPEFTLKDPDVQHMVRIIEMKRTGQMVGYQDGGFTNSSSSTSAAPFNAETSSSSLEGLVADTRSTLQATQVALATLIRRLDAPIEAHFTKRTIRDITEQQEKNSVMRNRNKLS